MNDDRDQIEANLRLHVDRLAELIGVRTLKKPKTMEATIGSIEGAIANCKLNFSKPVVKLLKQ
ncbi:hypothetical protein Q31b_47960 [Novipirellula aureliae]|uniref:Uncharacterized protein n=1 Tax=Novipirellula aureliae TaxID=2527966 RepID=A0A5C6DJU9_9BACT|nr:hypothetical protein [Novipirellula aureliae]TWU36515.1 hypothetical protein Q31b_47960 [Novipirellula aureliae]